MAFVITNTLKYNDPAYGTGYNLPGGLGVKDGVNPGAKTGPYGNGLRNNTLYIPLPLTNFQIELAAQGNPDEKPSSITIEAEGVLETEFLKALADTLPVTVVDDSETTGGEPDGGEG